MADLFPTNTPCGTKEPVNVGSLARALHNKNVEELEIEIPSDAELKIAEIQGASISEGKLRFASLGDRNQAVVSHVLAELGDHHCAPDALWNAARDLWRNEIGHTDMASGRLLATVHQHPSFLRVAASRITSASEAFNVLHLVEAALPHIGYLDVGDLLALCDVEYPMTQGDMAAGVFYGNLQRWFVSRPAQAQTLVGKILIAPSQARGSLLGAAWMAWFANDRPAAANQLLAVCTRTDEPLPNLTCWIAGRMLAESPDEAKQAVALEDLILRRIASSNPQECNAGLAAATSLLHLRRRFDEALRAQIEGGNAEAAAHIAQALSRETETLLASNLFFEWLPRCLLLDVAFARSINLLDYRLSTLLRPGSRHIDDVFGFLEGWIAVHTQTKVRRDERFAEQFDQCAHAISTQPPLCARMVTQWMLRDGLALPSAAAGVIARLARSDRDPSLRFDSSLLATASEADLRLLGARVLGFLINVDDMLSLALSLLDVTDAKNRIHPMMRWLLQQEIGYDYPSTTADRLRAHAEITDDTETKALLLDIAADLEDHLTALNDLPRLRELAPLRTLQREFQKARAKQMEQSMREGRKSSVLAKLVSSVHVKAGEASFQYAVGNFSQPMPFTSHSISFELPRREVIDPVGNAYRLHNLRSAKRDGI